MGSVPATNEERDAQDDQAVLKLISFGRARRAAKLNAELGWPLEARYSRLNAALQRLRKAGRIEYRTSGWHARPA